MSVADDFRMASEILSGVRRASRSFSRRFAEPVARALEHCREAVGLGLQRPAYERAVADAAARSLLASAPLTPMDARLDPHVLRVLGHRDFGLAVLLRDDSEQAWGAFRRRLGPYVARLLVRRGFAPNEADELVADVIAELRTPSMLDDRPPIAGYLGRSDLTLWLFAWVRNEYRGGLSTDARADAGDIPPGGASERGDPLTKAVRAAAQDVLGRLDEADQALLKILATGGTFRAVAASGLFVERGKPPGPERLLERHRLLIEEVFEGVVGAVRDSTGWKEPAASEQVLDLLVDEITAELTPICGGVS